MFFKVQCSLKVFSKWWMIRWNNVSSKNCVVSFKNYLLRIQHPSWKYFFLQIWEGNEFFLSFWKKNQAYCTSNKITSRKNCACELDLTFTWLSTVCANRSIFWNGSHAIPLQRVLISSCFFLPQKSKLRPYGIKSYFKWFFYICMNNQSLIWLCIFCHYSCNQMAAFLTSTIQQCDQNYQIFIFYS